MVERQLWWNFVGIPAEEKIKWFFVIVNDKREIRKISNRIFGRLAMIEELVEREGKADGMNYKLLVFNSEKKLEKDDISSIYRGYVKREERLYTRKRLGIDGLENYVQRKLKRNNKP